MSGFVLHLQGQEQGFSCCRPQCVVSLPISSPGRQGLATFFSPPDLKVDMSIFQKKRRWVGCYFLRICVCVCIHERAGVKWQPEMLEPRFVFVILQTQPPHIYCTALCSYMIQPIITQQPSLPALTQRFQIRCALHRRTFKSSAGPNIEQWRCLLTDDAHLKGWGQFGLSGVLCCCLQTGTNCKLMFCLVDVSAPPNPAACTDIHI